ncbi:MAG: hypothetical protein V2B13_09370 [Pseudomonadota bacterium]
MPSGPCLDNCYGFFKSQRTCRIQGAEFAETVSGGHRRSAAADMGFEDLIGGEFKGRYGKLGVDSLIQGILRAFQAGFGNVYAGDILRSGKYIPKGSKFLE